MKKKNVIGFILAVLLPFFVMVYLISYTEIYKKIFGK